MDVWGRRAARGSQNDGLFTARLYFHPVTTPLVPPHWYFVGVTCHAREEDTRHHDERKNKPAMRLALSSVFVYGTSALCHIRTSIELRQTVIFYFFHLAIFGILRII